MFSFSKVIDEKTFLEIINDDYTLIETILNLFNKQYAENIELMRSALRENDSRKFERASHDLKNLGRNIASEKLIQFSHKLEKSIESDPEKEVEKLINKTENTLKKAENELKKIQAKYKF